MNFIIKNKRILGVILMISALYYIWQSIIIPIIVLFAIGLSII